MNSQQTLKRNESVQSALRRWVDPMLDPEPTRLAPLLLGLAMLVSAAWCLYAGRGTFFSGDELGWVNLAADGLTLKEALQPASGHLLLVSKSLYAFVLDTFGAHYLIFRLFTLAAVFLAVGLLFHWARRRTGDWFALAPCVVLLFFGTDPGHIIGGNGFTIMFAVTCGMLALIGLERRDRAGDLLACVALCAGIATYSVALAFLVGAIVVVLADPDRWRRIWVVAVPVVLYAAWRIWVAAEGIDSTGGNADLKDLLLLPAWTFQSLSGILSALTGFHYDFSNRTWLPPGEMAGPALALAFLAWVVWRVGRAPVSRWFWIAVVIALALFASQVVTWIPITREPGTSRYLYPGAFAALLVLAETVRGMNPGRTSLIALWLVALTASATGAVLIQDSGNTLRARGVEVRGDITAVALLESSRDARPGTDAVPLRQALLEFDVADVGPAERDFGRLGYAPGELATAPAEARARVDSVLLATSAPYLEPLAGRPLGCEPAGADPALPDNASAAKVPGGRTVLFGRNGGNVSIRRFGDTFPRTLVLPAGQPALLVLPVDDDPTPWQIAADDPDLELCLATDR